MRMLVTSVLLAIVACVHGAGPLLAYTVRNDPGGQIGAYVEKYQTVRASGERVVIDGTCLSACTLVLGAIPPSRLCATPRTVLGFHSAWLPGRDGRPVTSSVATSALWSLYPQHVRRYLAARGGLKPRMMFVSGRALYALVPRCSRQAFAGS